MEKACTGSPQSSSSSVLLVPPERAILEGTPRGNAPSSGTLGDDSMRDSQNVIFVPLEGAVSEGTPLGNAFEIGTSSDQSLLAQHVSVHQRDDRSPCTVMNRSVE